MITLYAQNEAAEVEDKEELRLPIERAQVAGFVVRVLRRVANGETLAIGIDSVGGYEMVYDSTNAENLGTNVHPTVDLEAAATEVVNTIVGLY